MQKKKFISIIWGYHKQIFSFDKKQNYHMLPLEAMQEEGFECEIFAIDSQVRIEDDPNFVKWIKVIYCKGLIDYLIYLLKNRKVIIYSNTLTIKTLIVGLIGRRTVFMPHDYIFWSTLLKKLIITFFYRFFTKIRVNNDGELWELENLKKWLWVKIPLVVSSDFLNSNPSFSDKNILISLWNLIPKKQPEFLLQALSIVKSKGYDFTLKVIWEDRLKSSYGYSYAELVDKYNLVDSIECLWFVPHDSLPGVVKWALFYINTSRQEWFCLAVYESLLMGLWVILPDTLSFNGVFWKNALYYKAFDEQDLARKVILYIEDRKLLRNNIEQAQQYVLDNFNYEKVKTDLKNLFINL